VAGSARLSIVRIVEQQESKSKIFPGKKITMIKLSELALNWILKRGIIFDVDEFATDVEIPDTKIKAHIQAKHITITLKQKEEN